MSDYIIRLIHCFTKFFRKDKQIKAESSSKYSTPLRVPSRLGSSNFRNLDALAPQRSTPLPRRVHLDILAPQRATPLPRKVPMSCPIIRCPSQISVRRFGSEDDISFRADNFISNRPFNNSAQHRIRQPFDCHLEAEQGDCSRVKSEESEPEFPQVPAYKSSKSSLDYFAMAGDRLEPPAKSYEKNFPTKRQFNIRSSQLAHAGFPSKLNPSSSKIPVRNLSRYGIRPNLDFSKQPQRHRGRYTLTAHPQYFNDAGEFPGNDDAVDNLCFNSSDIGNWIVYRNDTSARFERMFKALSKKKHAIGNLIDATSHAHWLRLSGITADRDATMFKQFAGGKVVLTCGEYKFLIDKICQIHDLDYWDVLRKMATFQDEDLQVEALLTSQ